MTNNIYADNILDEKSISSENPFDKSIWLVVDKSNAILWWSELPTTAYLEIKKTDEELRLKKIYELINYFRGLMWLAKILPPTPFYK